MWEKAQFMGQAGIRKTSVVAVDVGVAVCAAVATSAAAAGRRELVERDRGTPQGSAVSPILANLFLHYAFDA
jgi:hypothetical protein